MSSGAATPVLITQPLINSIPPHLLSRFDPVYVEYYNRYNAGRLHTHQVPIEAYRADPLKYTIAYGRAIAPEVGRVTEQKCPVSGGEITIRIFEPNSVENYDHESTKLRPAYINFHGGGWVFGGLAVDHEFCKRVVHETGCVAFDVDYRLSPEFKFPIPVTDCWEAFNWVRTQKSAEFSLDTHRLAVGGCSAGGHIATIIAHMCRDASIPLAFQLLGVPVCDLHVFTPTGELDPECPYESYREMYDTVALPVERMAWFHRHFLGCPRPRELDNDWKVSPIRAPNFANLAPALIVTAELDPLRDEGLAYGKKMNEANSHAEVHTIKGVPHPFMQLDGILEGGKEYNRLAVDALRRAFSSN